MICTHRFLVGPYLARKLASVRKWVRFIKIRGSATVLNQPDFHPACATPTEKEKSADILQCVNWPIRRNLLIGPINQYVKLAFMGQISEVVLHGSQMQAGFKNGGP